MDKRILDKAQVIWNYHQLNHNIFKDEFANQADGILVFGSSDISVAHVAADLWLSLISHRLQKDISVPYIIFSGGMGTGPHSGCNLMGWNKPEAEIFSECVLAILKEKLDHAHLDKLQVFVETEARNSGENVDKTKQIIEKNDLISEKLIIVQKPFMERRTYSTFKCRWPNPDIKLHSSSVTLEEYPQISNIPLKEVIGIMLGDLQRIKLYAPPYGNFQIFQEIPNDVWNAFTFLTEDEEITRNYPEFKFNLVRK